VAFENLLMVAAAKLAKGELLAAVAGQDAIREPTPAAAPVTAATDIPENPGKAPVQPVLMRDGRRLWRFPAESIPEILNDDDIRPAVEARWCGCTLVADWLDLIVVEPWLSELPDGVQDGLAAKAGTMMRCCGVKAGFAPGRLSRERRRLDHLRGCDLHYQAGRSRTRPRSRGG
jgi:hypothetical protein